MASRSLESGRSETACAREDCVEHRFCEDARVRVLAAWVIRSEQCHRVALRVTGARFGSMSEKRLAFEGVAGGDERVLRRSRADRSQADDDAQRAQ